jgi:hypothetical protein
VPPAQDIQLLEDGVPQKVAPSARETRRPHQVQVKLREPGSGTIYGGVRTVVH